MKSIAYYRSLPDTMSEADLVREFKEILELAMSSGRCRADFLSALLELSERQWHSYTDLCQPLKAKVEESLVYYWDGFDLEFVEGAIAVAAKLGLAGVLTFMKALSEDGLSPEVAIEIKEAIAELSAEISNPYSGM